MTVETNDRYPYTLKDVLIENSFENILDNNMFSSFIRDELPLPQVEDPRKNNHSGGEIPRHPEFVRAPKINQVFSYIGYIKRTRNRGLENYLPMLFYELNLFMSVLEDCIFNLDVMTSEDIYQETKRGYENFQKLYQNRSKPEAEWIEEIWKRQKNYLEKIDMLSETLKARGHVFDFSDEPLFDKIVSTCKTRLEHTSEDTPDETDYRFVANSYVKAFCDRQPKTLWSGDKHILQIMECIHDDVSLRNEFPSIRLRAGYFPQHFAHLFP